MGYTVFSRFYDAAMQDYSWCSGILEELFSDVPQGSSRAVLEMGCGTGRVLELVSPWFDELWGIDLVPEMLQAARKRLPQAEFSIADMRRFTLKRSFDAAICIFDTINHLITFSDWEAAVEQAADHLKPGGLFLMDMNTPLRLQRLALLPPFITEFTDGGMLLMEVEDLDDGQFKFNVQIFEALGGERFQRHREEIREYTPDPQQVRILLEQQFSAVQILNEEGEPADDETAFTESLNGRLFFICRNRTKGRAL